MILYLPINREIWDEKIELLAILVKKAVGIWRKLSILLNFINEFLFVLVDLLLGFPLFSEGFPLEDIIQAFIELSPIRCLDENLLLAFLWISRLVLLQELSLFTLFLLKFLLLEMGFGH